QLALHPQGAWHLRPRNEPPDGSPRAQNADITPVKSPHRAASDSSRMAAACGQKALPTPR
ncbi:MAG: hypothetical protein ACKO2L_02525, partial [Planctomycetaceae bacterium]